MRNVAIDPDTEAIEMKPVIYDESTIGGGPHEDEYSVNKVYISKISRNRAYSAHENSTKCCNELTSQEEGSVNQIKNHIIPSCSLSRLDFQRIGPYFSINSNHSKTSRILPSYSQFANITDYSRKNLAKVLISRLNEIGMYISKTCQDRDYIADLNETFEARDIHKFNKIVFLATVFLRLLYTLNKGEIHQRLVNVYRVSMSNLMSLVIDLVCVKYKHIYEIDFLRRIEYGVCVLKTEYSHHVDGSEAFLDFISGQWSNLGPGRTSNSLKYYVLNTISN